MSTSDSLDELFEKLSSEKSPEPIPRMVRTRTLRADLPVRPSAKPQRRQLLSRLHLRRKKKPAKERPHADPPSNPLWSSRHPAAFKGSRFLLARLPVLLLAVPLSYAMLANLIKGDYFFFVRWYHKSWILPGLVQVLSSKAAFSAWWHDYGVLTCLIVITIFICGTVLYMAVWRLLFKDYTRYSEGVETPEGRAMWIEGSNMWFGLWDFFYGRRFERKFGQKYAPNRQTVTVFLRPSLFPLINPASPGRNMLKIQLSLERGEKLERRGPYELVGHEGQYRRLVGIREFRTHNDLYTSAPIPLTDSQRIFQSRVGSLVKDTQKLTHANVGVRLDKMKAGTVVVDPEVRQMVLDERRKTGT